MAIDYGALKAECQNNPNAYSYTDTASNTTLTLAQWYAAGADAVCAAILNRRRGAITIPRSDVVPQEILEAIRIQDLNTTTNIVAGSWFESVMQSPTMRLLKTDGTDTRVLTNIMFLLSNGSGSEARLRALATRTGSRAEQLFGEATVISTADMIAARAA